MGPEWVAIIALVALFVIGTLLPINMGALAYVAAWLVGMYALDLDEKEILAGVSGDLILTLIGVTYLFAIARNNGTVDLIVRTAVRARRRPRGADPVGDVRRDRGADRHRCRQPGGLRDHRPDRPRLRRPLRHQPADDGHVRRARRPGRRLLADQHLRHDHQLRHGGRRAAVERDHRLPRQPGRQHAHGRDPLRRPRRPQADGAADRPRRRPTPSTRTCTAAAPPCPPAATARRRRPAPRPSAYAATRCSPCSPSSASRVIALVFDKNIGFVAITAAVILAMLAPNEHKDAVKQIAWPTVLLVAGVSTYATILTTAGSPEFVGTWAAGPRRGRHRRADPLLRRRRRLGVRLLDGAAAGDHPDRRAADRRRRHQRRALRGGPRGVLDDRRRQPVLAPTAR